MSLNGAIKSSVSGLKANAQALGATTDNVTNGRTVGYKRTETMFSTLVGASSGTTYVPGGVSAVTSRLVDEVGIPTSTASRTDLFIDGKGFFVVSPDSANQSSRKLLTRAGNFFPDNQGRLKNAAGLYLQGWATNSDGTTKTTNKSSLDVLETIDISLASNGAQKTQNMEMGLNLPVQSSVGETLTASDTVYDSLGAPHALTLNWTKTVTSPQTWQLTATVAGGVVSHTSGLYADVPIVFDSNGAPASFDGVSTPTASMPAMSIVWDNSAAPSTINLNLGTIGKLDGVTALQGDNVVTKREQDGVAVGNFSYVDIDDLGIVTAFFDNQTSVKIYKIPVAIVPNSRGMEAVSGNAFSISSESGRIVLSEASEGSAGSILAQKLEESTVDIASEFSDMTLSQQNFSACTQSFRTANEMFSKLEQLSR